MAVILNIISAYDDRAAKKAQRSLASLGSGAKGFAGSVAADGIRAGRALGQVGTKMSETGASMTRNVSLPLGVIGALAFKTAGDFEQSMNMVQAATDAPAAEMEKLGALAKKMGADTVYSANEAAGAMLEMAKSGMTPAQIQAGGLKAALELAAAGGVALESAATTTSNALNMFGLEAKDAASVADAFAGGANASSASVDSLQQALSQVGPGARNAGLSLQDTVGVLAAFADKGIQGSDAGTSLKVMLQRLIPETDKAEQAMKRYGLSFVDSKGNIDDITVVAEKLKKQLSGLSEEERNSALQRMFGSDATRAATVLMNEGEKGIQKYITATEDLTAAEKMAEARMKGSKGSIEQMTGSVETAALAIGQGLAPTVIQGANAVKRFADGFATLDQGTQTTIVKLGLVTVAAGPVVQVMGAATQAVGGLVSGVSNLTMAFGANAAAAPVWARAIASGGVASGVAAGALAAVGYVIWANVRADIAATQSRGEFKAATDKAAEANRALKASADALPQLQRNVATSELGVRQARLNLATATDRVNQLQHDGKTKTKDYKQALIDLDRAKIDLKNVKDALGDSKKAADDAEKSVELLWYQLSALKRLAKNPIKITFTGSVPTSGDGGTVKPPKKALGGIIPATAGGQHVIMAEAGVPEMALPLENTANSRNLLALAASWIGGGSAGSGFAFAGGGSPSRTLNVHPGAITLVLPPGTSQETQQAAGNGVLAALAREWNRS